MMLHRQYIKWILRVQSLRSVLKPGPIIDSAKALGRWVTDRTNELLIELHDC